MSQRVYRFNERIINSMKQYYHKSLTEIPQGAIFRAKTPHAVITAYKSGKVLFQGKAPELELEKWMDKHQSTSTEPERAPITSSYYPPSTLFTSSHIGSDEAGTGDYFGPITVASAYVHTENINELKKIGINDSKNFRDDAIVELSKEIVKRNIPYSLLILHNNKYNSLQKKGWSQGKMKAMLHHHAISHLMKKIGDKPLAGILIDQFCDPKVYQKHLASEKAHLHDQTFFMTKAESHSIAVATGSIIARASFVKEMDKLSNQLGIQLQKGASKLVDKQIANILKNNDKEILTDIAKVHFANTKKAQAYM